MVENYPQVFCVNYRLDDFVVVFRTHLGTKLLAAAHANIGFKVFDDPGGHDGLATVPEGMEDAVKESAEECPGGLHLHRGLSPPAGEAAHPR